MGPVQTEWVKRLREHPERQLTGRLGERNSTDYKACCLGELWLTYCDIKGQQPQWDFDQLHINGLNCYFSDEATDELGLRSFAGGSKKGKSLATLNDSGSTWTEIADMVEKDIFNYFTKEI